MRKNPVYLSILFLCLIILVLPKAHGQQRYVMNLQGYNEQPYHFGFILGLNQMLFTLKPVDNMTGIKWNNSQSPDIAADSLFVYSVNTTGAPGFSVGILGSLRLRKYLDLRFIPTLSFGSRNLLYTIRAFKNGNIVYDKGSSDSTFVHVKKQINSTYITFPLLIKYRSYRDNNIGAYFLGGISYSIDLAAAKRTKQNANNTNSGIIKMRTHDFSIQAGAGFDFYTPYFKLGVEAKMIYGLNNLIIKENDLYSGSIKSMHSKMFMLSFIFE